MGKHDMPTLEFTVERGRLVPAGPYEAEVLNTYRPGSKLTITLHQKRSLPLLKKYWAVMRDVVDQCKTPWNSPDEASDAIKLALGVTDIGKTVKGQWFIRPGSIAFTSMDEAAFREYFEKAMAILAEVTGIDPVELRQRYSHIAEAEYQSSDSPSPSDDNGSDGKSPSPESTVAADSSATSENHSPGEAASEAGDIEAQEEPDASSASEPISDHQFLIRVYQTMQDCVGPSVEDFNQAFKIFADELAAASDEVKRKAENIRASLEFCCGEKPMRTKLQARSYLAGIIGVDEKELA